jgi:protease YdgD
LRRPSHNAERILGRITTISRGKSIIGKAYLLLAVLLAASGHRALADELHPGIIGTDDRQRVETEGPPWDAIGQVNIAGYRRLFRCTGTLIAPDMVITAAHCVMDTRTRAPFPLRNIHFLAGVRGERHKGHAIARCVQVLSGYDFGSPTSKASSDTIARDAALIVLEQALDVAPIRLVDPERLASDAPLTHAAYAADRRYVLSVHTGCQRLPSGQARNVWRTDCDTHPASSGGPVFHGQGGETRLAAIMIGAGGGATYALPASEWRGLVDQRQCR